MALAKDHVPATMTYPEWKKSFVDGDKSGLKTIEPMEKQDKMNHTMKIKLRYYRH